jgi:sugar transferase (PEP-CTERM/EpsH1 system associated)
VPLNPLRPVPTVAHVLYQLAAGGMENGVVNLVNGIPGERFHHIVVSLTGCTDFQSRISNPSVEVIALHKRPGKDPAAYVRLWRLLRRLRPEIVYTHSMATLDVQFFALLAGVPGRIHGEHGQRSSGMLPGRPPRSWLRRLAGPLIHRYTTVSRDLTGFLEGPLGIPPARVTQIYNGVDTGRFHPRGGAARPGWDGSPLAPDSLVIGTAGRMETVKDQATLVRAFLCLLKTAPALAPRLRLALIGAGPLREECRALLEAAGAADLAWLPGERDDIPDILRGFDVFVLPSISEGASNTILEAMATGLPVVATDVGGNPELVEHGRTGLLVPAGDPVSMAQAIARYLQDPDLRAAHGAAGRARVESHFSMRSMIENYIAVYQSVLARKRAPHEPHPSGTGRTVSN